jgi:hypothetical protein
MIMKELQKHVELLIRMALGNKSSCIAQAARRTLASFVLIAVVLAAVSMQQQVPIYASQSDGHNGYEKSNGLRLVLQVPKRRFRVGEPIEITAYLENISDRPYYVGNTFTDLLVSTGLHDMRLIITDEKGKEVPIGRGGGSWIWKQNTSVADKLAQAYVHLRAGAIHGVKERLSLPLQSGQYRLTVTYHEEEALQWAKTDRDSLPIPVWTKKLTSNTITITVIR